MHYIRRGTTYRLRGEFPGGGRAAPAARGCGVAPPAQVLGGAPGPAEDGLPDVVGGRRLQHGRDRTRPVALTQRRAAQERVVQRPATACNERMNVFYLTTHSTHFIYGYMASDIWLRTILIVRKETRCPHIGYITL